MFRRSTIRQKDGKRRRRRDRVDGRTLRVAGTALHVDGVPGDLLIEHETTVAGQLQAGDKGAGNSS